eukprot:TRINITY_DN31581_c0_g1_i1.p1 TRINITY_DN31581_c0_g1~~TRINITY_DN31581_c0_g1_i1.p1  ORF type:complete len:778 (+),score=83.46 TRINITY_DN31581_c0_g1_i1:206-2539(+)
MQRLRLVLCRRHLTSSASSSSTSSSSSHSSMRLGRCCYSGPCSSSCLGILERRFLSNWSLPSLWAVLDLTRSGGSPPPGWEKFFKNSHRNKGGRSSSSNNKESSPGDGEPGSGSDTVWLKRLASLCVVNYVLISLMAPSAGSAGIFSTEITFQEFVSKYVSSGMVEKVQVVNKSVAVVTLRPTTQGAKDRGTRLHFVLGSAENFEERMEAVQASLGIAPAEYIPVQYSNASDSLEDFRSMLPMIFFALLGVAMLRNMKMPNITGGAERYLKRKNLMKEVKSDVRFGDVAGLHEAKQEVMEFVDFLKHPSKYEGLGARIPKGALLSGPPGTGKTLLAKAVAGEAEVPFFSISGSDFLEVYVGVGPARVRDLFAKARKCAPSIVFIDEIDAVGRKRSSTPRGGNDERENTLNQLLVEMDGFAENTGVVVLAGTNRADMLDQALTRPGRFDRSISIGKPSLQERKELYLTHLKPIKLSDDLDSIEVASRLAALSPGFVGATIANVCNEAAINAARRSSCSGVEMEDFERATERTTAGLPRSEGFKNADEKRVVAFHEAGHALTGWMLEHADPVLKLTIVPRSSGALGYAQHLPDELSLQSKQALLDRMAVILGGRAAEELFIGRISSGAANDLQQLTKIAYRFVAVLGMNLEVGLVSYEQEADSLTKPFSEQTAQLIDTEVKKIVDEQYTRVKALLLENKEKMQLLVDLLYERETVNYKEIEEILGNRPFDVSKAFLPFVRADGMKSLSKKKKKPEALEEPDENSASSGPSASLPQAGAA